MRRVKATVVFVAFSIACARVEVFERRAAPFAVVVETNLEDEARSFVVRVRTPDHRPIVGALVAFECGCLGMSRDVETNLEGVAIFKGAPAGSYTVHVLHRDHATTKVLFPTTGSIRVTFEVEVTLPPRTRVVDAPRVSRRSAKMRH